MNRSGPFFSVSGAVFLPQDSTATPDPHVREMARMLAEISTQLEALGEVLCHDPEFVDRHVQALQAIDLIAQKQRALAEVLGAECPTSALAGVGLEEVVARVRHLGDFGESPGDLLAHVLEVALYPRVVRGQSLQLGGEIALGQLGERIAELVEDGDPAFILDPDDG